MGFARVLLLLALAVRPAAAGSILFATAATHGGIDAFCLTPTGTFAEPRTPVRQFGLAQTNPRRILYVPDFADPESGGVLYVAETDRLEAFRMGPDGNVDRQGRTEVREGLDVRGMAVDTATRTLYVLERGPSRVTSYPLDDTGLPVVPPDGERFTSCVQGLPGLRYYDLALSDGKVFASAEVGRLDGWGTAPDGRLCTCHPCAGPDEDTCSKTTTCKVGDPCVATTPAECPTITATSSNVKETPVVLQRRRLSQPQSMLVSDGLLYVQESFARQLSAFAVDQLRPPPGKVCKGGTNNGQACSITNEAKDCPGGICHLPRVCVNGPQVGIPCTVDTAATDCGAGNKCGRAAPKRVSHTGLPNRYSDLELAGSTFLGSQFFDGRIDAFFLAKPDKPKDHCSLTACPGSNPRCCLPRQRSDHSDEDVRMSPVGLTTALVPGGMVLYVAAGVDDRVRAYRLNTKGLLASPGPISETVEQSGSFPNDVAVAVLRSVCR